MCQMMNEFKEWLQLTHMYVIAHFRFGEKCMFKVNAIEACCLKKSAYLNE